MKSLSGIDLLALQERLTFRKNEHDQTLVLDPVRRRYVRATPEEIVRQLWIRYLLDEKKLNPKLIAVERLFTLNTLRRRFDMVIFNKDMQPVLLAEFKSPGSEINQPVFDQVAQYNMKLHVPLALVSNGHVHYVFRVEEEKQRFRFLDTLSF